MSISFVGAHPRDRVGDGDRVCVPAGPREDQLGTADLVEQLEVD
jgi:hypothetical protein